MIARLVLLVVSMALLSCGGGGGGDGAGSGTGTGGGGGTSTTLTGTVELGADTAGIKVALKANGSTVATADVDVQGNYSFAGVPPGTYEVMPSYADWLFVPSARTVTVSAAAASVPAFAVAPEDSGNTPEELAAQDASLLANPPPEWPPEPLATDRKVALAVPAPGEERRKWILDTMLSRARNFYGCGHNNPACTQWNILAGANAVLQPAQSRLAYLWGGDKYADSSGNPARFAPSAGSTCTKELVGLDCSGLMHNLAKDAQIDLSGDLNAWFQGDPKNWKSIPDNWGVRLVKLPAGTYQRGDIIVWPSDKRHIGIAVEDGTNPFVFSSTGGQTASCEENMNKGPRRVQLSFIKSALPSHILRFTADPIFALNTKTSWRPKFFDYDTYTGSVVSVLLTSLNGGKPLPSGSYLELTPKGQWTYSGASIATGAAGRLLAGGSVVQPAAGSTTVKGGVPADCQAGPDPYPDDFILFDGATHKVVLPQGATALELAVDDCVMADNNPVPADPIRVSVKLVLPPP